jgi:beta-glucosidase/6-phospho-beta-glucosidase/beta-galactosidase
VHGNYPQVMIDRIGERSEKEGFDKSRLPEFTSQEIEDIKGTYDFIGLNHYTTSLAEWIEDYEIGEPSSNKDISVKGSIDDSWESSASSWLKVKSLSYHFYYFLILQINLGCSLGNKKTY